MFNTKQLKKKGLILFSVISIVSGLLFAPIIAYANNKLPINARLQEQLKKINQGVKLKQLTPQEKKILEQEQQAIKLYKKMLKNDGTLSIQDKQKIHKKLDDSNLHIYNLRFNKQRVKTN